MALHVKPLLRETLSLLQIAFHDNLRLSTRIGKPTIPLN
jgi:hypothetical protein